MKRQAILLIASILFILVCINSAYAEDSPIVQENSNNSFNSNDSSFEAPKETFITGKVNDCNTKNPFPGVNVTVTNNGEFIASNITGNDGSYQINFLSNYNNFNVTACHMGHNPLKKEVIVSPLNESSQYGSVDFELGNIYVNMNTGNDDTGDGSINKPYKTVQKGIDKLNKNKGGTLYIANGTYSITNQLTIEYNSNIYGDNKDSTIIQGNNQTRIFLINEKINVKIANLTIRYGGFKQADNRDDGHDGAGIYNKGTLIIDNCNIYNNTAGKGGSASGLFGDAGRGGYGGGVYNDNKGILTIQNSILHDNSAGKGGSANEANGPGHGGHGGAIYNKNVLTILNCEIYNNHGGIGGDPKENYYYQGNGGNGGAIYMDDNSIASIMSTRIHNNAAGTGIYGCLGGAIYNKGSLNLTGCTINNNQAVFLSNGYGQNKEGGNGGAIYNTKTLNIIDCQITNNKAGDGPNGANSKWKKNQYYYAGGDGCNGGSGGGIYNTGTLTLTDSSISNNIAGNGGKGGSGQDCYEDSDGNPKVSTLDPGNGGNGGNGGGIYNSGTITSIKNSSFNNNIAGKGGDGGLYYDNLSVNLWYKVKVATAGYGGSGGAIYSAGKLNLLENTAINNNAAGNGGNGNPVSRYSGGNGNAGGNGGGLALYNPITITGCQLTNNKAGDGGKGASTNINGGYNPSTNPGNGGNGGSGGGIYYYYSDNNQAITIRISNSTLNNNSAGNGGAGGIDDYYHSKSSNGGAGGNGGAIAIISKTIAKSANYGLKFYLEESTVTNNKAGACGQPYLTGKSPNGVGGGLYSNDNHYFTVHFCRIINNTANNTIQAVYLNLSSINAYTNLFNNWWGSNSAPSGQIAGSYIDPKYYSPWLILSISANPTTIYSNQNSNIAANLIMNSAGYNTLLDWAMYVPDGIPVAFSTNLGTVNPQNGVTTAGFLNTVFTANGGSGTATVFATVDNQIVSTQIQILPSADVQIIKTVNNTRPNIGETVTFIVTAKNNGSDNATNIQITDKIPGGFDNIIIIPSVGTYNSTTGVWAISELVNGTYATLTITGTIRKEIAGINTTNTATKTKQDQVDPNPNNDQSSATIYVPVADIQITKTVDKNKPNAGETVTFTITAKNNGPDDATNIKITDSMPSGITVNSINPTTGSYSGGVWTLNLANGATATLTMIGTITGDIAGKTTTNNAVKTAADQYDPNSNNNNASANIYVPLADIHITKTVNENKPNVGDRITFTVTVINDGPDNATNLQITDTMPAGFDNVEIIPSIGTYNSTTGIWSIPELLNRANTTLTLSGNINAAAASQTITNTATKTEEDQYDPTPDDDTASASINVQEADVDITKTADKTSANVGENVIFTITVTNKGPNTATGLIFIDKLPAGLKFNSASATVGTTNHAGNYILWNLGTLPNSTSAILTINTTVMTPGYLTNTIRKISEDQYDPDVDFANATVYAPQADISITKSASNSILNVGNTATFTVIVHNNGPDNATNIQITDIMPVGFNDVIIIPSTGIYDVNTGFWTIPFLENGANATLTLSGIVNSTIAGKTAVNNATKTASDQYDPNPDNNHASASIYIALADIHIAKTVDKNNPNVGDKITFKVIAINDGPDTATNVQITDTMPAGFNNVIITPSIGTYDANTNIWTIPFLENGVNATLTLSGIVNSAIANQIVTNIATKTSADQYDSTPFDDTASASMNVQEADVDIIKTVNKIRANIGDNVIFTITATNNGPDAATGLKFLDKLPVGLELNTAVADKGILVIDENNIYWNLGSLNNGESATLTINTTVNTVKNMLNIVRKIHEDQYDPDTDFATAIVYVLEADVSITNTANRPKLNVGDTAVFTVTVRNNGPNKATNVVINDIIPSGFTANVSKGTINNGIWYIGTLERNEETILILTGVITPDWAGKTIYNNVTETQDEYNSFPQTVSANIYVPEADVLIFKGARNVHFDLNDNVRFLLILKNQGPDAATDIKVIDNLPDDLEFISASNGGIFNPVLKTVTWNLDNLNNGLYYVFILQTKVKSYISNNLITNTAFESQNEYNNEIQTANATITINKADLYLTGTVNKSNIKVGDKFTVKFKLGNRGPDAAKNVVVKIPIPEGLEFISVSVDQGIWSYDKSTRTVIWTVGEVKVGDPYLYLTLKAVKRGHYTLYPSIFTTTYDPNIESPIIPVKIDIYPQDNTVNATTVDMQKTGMPIYGLILAILAVLTGLISFKRH